MKEGGLISFDAGQLYKIDFNPKSHVVVSLTSTKLYISIGLQDDFPFILKKEHATGIHQYSLLLTWFNFNPNMDK